MERKLYLTGDQSTGLKRPAHQNTCREHLHITRSSSVPRLPPIVRNEMPVSKSPTFARITSVNDVRTSGHASKLGTSPVLPRLERFESATSFFHVAEDHQSKLLSTKLNPRLENPEVPTREINLSLMKDFHAQRQNMYPIPNALLKGRKKKKDRLSSYRCTNSEIIDDEISGLEQRVGFDAISPTSSHFAKDMQGRMIRSSEVYCDGVSSLINIVDKDEEEKSKKEAKDKGTSETECSKSLTSISTGFVRQRFLKALDTHFYSEFASARTGRRMAICEELEKLIIGDGNTSLNGLREHLRLQDVLDSWVL